MSKVGDSSDKAEGNSQFYNNDEDGDIDVKQKDEDAIDIHVSKQREERAFMFTI